jgi:Family of unknown function (DUF6364)
MAKTKLTLYVEESLIEQMKIAAVQQKRSVSEITEALYRRYLKLKQPKAVR